MLDTSSAPPVSVCLTTYNRAHRLPAVLDSLLAQDFSDFELIISDDCSSDHTQEVGSEYSRRDGRVRYVRNAKNLGMPGNLNSVVQQARGMYIAIVHDDNIYRQDLLAKWKSALDAFPDAPFVFNDYDTIHPDGSRRVYRMTSGNFVRGTEIATHYFKTVTCAVFATVMMRRTALVKAGPFDSTFGFISDVDMWLRLARDAENIAYVPEPLITIYPREPHHPYRHVHWRHVFWSLGIYTKHLRFYHETHPDLVAPYVSAYPRLRRRYMFRSMAYLVKYRQWQRVREGLAIWRDADDFFLKRLGYLFGTPRWRPDWYHPGWWKMASAPRL